MKRTIFRLAQPYMKALRQHLRPGLQANLHPALCRGGEGLASGLETVDRRTLELAAIDRQLQRGIARRKSVEAALKKRGVHYARLLKTSLHLQEDLRQLTHRVRAAQEDERKQISIKLPDKIAQTLLGINVCLLTLKQRHAPTPKVAKMNSPAPGRLC